MRDVYFRWGGQTYFLSQLVTKIKTDILKKININKPQHEIMKINNGVTTLVLLNNFYFSVEMCFPAITWPPICSEVPCDVDPHKRSISMKYYDWRCPVTT